jgi:hypothetical protein
LHTLPVQYAQNAAAPSAATVMVSRDINGAMYPPPLGAAYESKETIPIAECNQSVSFTLCLLLFLLFSHNKLFFLVTIAYDARTTYMPSNDIYTTAINPSRRSVTAGYVCHVSTSSDHY